jgi:regulation of enolase protein 1 (concanavalin A-like superfamily)
MVTFTGRYTGEKIIQTDLPYNNWINSPQENALFNPGTPQEPITASFYNTHHPRESDNVSWLNANIDWTISTTASPTDFTGTISLYGIQIDGREELISEKIITSIDSTPTTTTYNFDLASSRGQAPLKKVTGTATTNKVQLDLPMRYSNFDELELETNWLDGWNKRKPIPLTGTSQGEETYYAVTVTPQFDSDMNTDFSDIRFCCRDAKTEINHFQVTKTDSTSAVYRVEIPQTPANSVAQRFYMYYDNDSATSASNGTNTFEVYDGFDDESIDADLWTESKPVGSITEGSNVLTLAVSAGVDSRWRFAGSTADNAPIVYTPLPSYDFDCRIKINTFTVGGNYGFGGMMLYKDRQNALRWGRLKNGATNGLYMDKVVGGTTTSDIYAAAVSNSPIWFRITKDNSIYRIYYSSNGSDYTLMVDTTVPLGFTPTHIGFFVINFDASYPSVNMTIDDYCVTKYSTPACVVGAMEGEESTISVTPDTATGDDMNVDFSWPNDWNDSVMVHVNATEYHSTSYESPDITASTPYVLELGYDSVDKYHALRFKVDVTGDKDYSVRVNEINYKYEVL